ncbi:hypothetical protein J8273_6867 [Carpediemonas membranifera]|uniref:Uncharacterized protein n=1 Tax=Carpediemonas membranifera TaxID=201153 RepID=A0A8J6DYA5_9EUKA|nr:hypothetical protein J8273_6867 [Carpediemonas membranifera]|eukprot:KAG9391854.1 hypothetical protein J8273_6867 [Carpediemonas membranifera]
MHAGADPDLENTETHSELSQKEMWFLCRKFYFSMLVAEKDGSVRSIAYSSTSSEPFYEPGSAPDETTDTVWTLHRFAGPVFERGPCSTRFTWVRMPPVYETTAHDACFIAQTVKGLYWWRSEVISNDGPVRIARYAASLPHWRKHRIVRSIVDVVGCIFLLTPVDLVVWGDVAEEFAGNAAKGLTSFCPVSLPSGSVPDHIMTESGVVVLTCGRKQMIADRDKPELEIGCIFLSGDDKILTRAGVDEVLSHDFRGIYEDSETKVWATESETRHICTRERMLDAYIDGGKLAPAAAGSSRMEKM